MNDDYLWDKSGEPDAEVERLERLLGKFHHQPQPLEMPAPTPRRMLFPSLAVAAAVALIAVALGVWLNWQSQEKEIALTGVGNSSVASREKAPEKPVDSKVAKQQDAGSGQQTQDPKPHRRLPQRQLEASRPLLVTASMTEEEKAKAQLMLALHIASSKLNLAQKKIQASAASGPRS
jgi:hypothetical protein